MNDSQTLKRNFLWNTAGSLIYFAAQWLFTVLAVSLSGVEASGLLQTGLNATSIFLSVASYGMYSYQVSDAHEKYAQTAYIRSRIYTCTLAVVLCFGFVLMGAFSGQNPYTPAQIACIFLVLAFRLVESVTDVYNAINQKAGRLDIVGKTYAARGILSLVLFAGTLAVTQNMITTLALMILGNLVFFFANTKQKAKPFYTKTNVAQNTVLALLWECAPLAIYSFLNTTTASIPKIMLERLLGSDAIGIYGPVTAPVLLLTTCANYLFIPFITTFSDRYAKKDERGFYTSILKVVGVIALLLVAGIFVAKYLGAWGLRTFIKPELAQYAYLLTPMVFAAILTAAVLFFSMVLTVMRCMKGLIFANVCAIAVAAAVSVPCIERWQLQGATYASIIAFTVQVVCLAGILLINARHYFKQP